MMKNYLDRHSPPSCILYVGRRAATASALFLSPSLAREKKRKKEEGRTSMLEGTVAELGYLQTDIEISSALS